MPLLLAEAEYTFGTDFALAGARQDEADDGETQTYAASGPGVIGLQCGTKYANVHLRLERWDERPPSVDDEWEDRDLLPWRTIRDAGPLIGHGFEPLDDDALDLGDLEFGRVEVLAAGRHRYGYSDGVFDNLPPERWLLRLWPTDGPVDAFAGPPRRIAGSLPFSYPNRTPFQSAIHGWSQTGWSGVLNAITAYREIEQAMRRIGRPAVPREVAEAFGPWGTQRDKQGPYTWDSPVHHPWHSVQLGLLARAAGIPDITTFADMLTALRALGLLVDWHSADGALLVPNPAPVAIWDVLPDLPSERHARIHALESDYRSLERDISHFLRWAPDGTLTASLTRLAVRLGLPVGEVVGVLRLLELRGAIAVDPQPTPAEPGEPITVTATSTLVGL